MSEQFRVFPGLIPNSRYIARVRAISNLGSISTWSEAVDFQTPADNSVPNAPTDLTLSFNRASVIMAWTPPTKNTDDTFFRDFSYFLVEITDGTTTVAYKTVNSFFSYSLDENEQDFGDAKGSLNISVKAVDITDKESAPLTGSISNAAPSKPQDIEHVTALLTIVLTFKANVVDKDIVEFIVERSTTSPAAGFTEIARTEGDTFFDTRTSGNTSHYRYKAVDAFGQESGYSEVASIYVEAPDLDDTPPENVANFAVIDNAIDDSSRKPYVVFQWDPNNIDDDLQYFDINIETVPTTVRKSYIVGPGASSYRVDDLAPGTNYTAQITAVDYFGNISTPTLVVDDNAGVAGQFTTEVDNQPPAVPVNPVTVTNFRSITISWDTVSSHNLSTYRIYQSDTAGVTTGSTKIYEGNSNRFVHQFSDAGPHTSHYIITAVGTNAQESAPSVEFSETTLTGFVTDDEAPTWTGSLSATPSTYYHGEAEKGYVELDWTIDPADNIAVTGIVVRYRENNVLEWQREIRGFEPGVFQIQVDNLNPDSVYDFGLRALDAAGNESPEISANNITFSTDKSITPLTPTGLTVISESPGTVRATWAPNINVPLRAYFVDINDGTSIRTIEAKATEITFSGITQGTYGVQIRAESIYGLVSAPTAEEFVEVLQVKAKNLDRVLATSVSDKLNVNFEEFDKSQWSITTGPTKGTVVYGDEYTGGAALEVQGTQWAVYTENLIPFDVNKTYKMTIRVKETVESPGGKFYAGFSGWAADGTTKVNVNGLDTGSSQHYFVASAELLTQGEWKTYTGYVKGHAANGQSGNSFDSPDNPAKMHADVRYVSPLYIVDLTDGTGTTIVDFIKIEAIDLITDRNFEDGSITSLVKFGGDIRPPSRVTSLPALPNSLYADGALVYLTTDNKLYRNENGAWSKAVPTSDLDGVILEAQIDDGAVTGAKMNSAVAEKLYSRTLGMKINTQVFAGTSNPGELYLHGFDAEGEAADIDGFIHIGDTKYTISRGDVFTKVAGEGWLVYSTAEDFLARGYDSVTAGDIDNVLYVQLVDGVWKWDNNSALLPFTPADTDYLIGYLKTGTDSITKGYLFKTPIAIEEAVVNAGRIVAGSIYTDALQANAITANKLNITMGGGNIVPNSNFANGNTGWSNAFGLGTNAVDGTYAYRGSQSLKITKTVATAGTSGASLAPTLALQPNTTYTASAWMYNPTGNTGSSPSIRAGGDTLEPKQSSGAATKGKWIRITHTFTTTGTASPTLTLYLYGPTVQNESVYFDAIQVEEGDVATSYSPKTDEILPGTINAAMIQTDAVEADKIKADAVTADKIKAGEVVAGKLAADAVVASNILAGEINTDHMTANTIDADRLKANTITANKLNVIMGGENLVTNSSFENSVNWKTGWVSGSNTLTFTSSTDKAKYGPTSMKVQGTGVGTSSGYIATGYIPVDEEKSYTASMWANVAATSSHAFRIILRFYDSGLVQLSTTDFYVDNSAPLKDKWQRVIGTATSPAGTTSAKFWIAGTGSAATDQIVYIDGVQLEEGDYATAYSPQTDEILPGTINAAMVQANAIEADKIKSDQITVDHIDALDLNALNAKVTGRLQAGSIVVGSGSQYDTGYDPTEKETPAGAQAKATQAKTDANTYTVDYAEKTITKDPDAPISPAIGDLWLETDTTPNFLYRWDGAGWKAAGPTGATQIGGEPTRIESNTAPAVPQFEGALWVDTSVTPNILKRYNGSAWVKLSVTTAAEVGSYTTTQIDDKDTATYELALFNSRRVNLGVFGNQDSFSNSNPGEMYIYSYDIDGNSVDVDGWIYFDGVQYTVPKGMIAANTTKDKLLLFDPIQNLSARTGANAITSGGSNPRCVAVYKESSDGKWYYDNNTGTDQEFTPLSTDLAIGFAAMSTYDTIDDAFIFGEPVRLTSTTQAVVAGSQVAADLKNVVIRKTSIPNSGDLTPGGRTNFIDGDLWINPNANNEIKVWNASPDNTFVSARDGNIAEAAESADAKNVIFYQSTTPTTGELAARSSSNGRTVFIDGDIWVDTANENETLVYDTSGVYGPDGFYTARDATIETAQVTADGRNVIFYKGTIAPVVADLQNKAPNGRTTFIEGDLWIDTDDNHIYVHTGGDSPTFNATDARDIVSSNVGTTMFHDPLWANWSTGVRPPGWSAYNGGGTLVAGLNGTSAMRFVVSAAGNLAGIYARPEDTAWIDPNPGSPNHPYVTLELTARLISGSWGGAGVLVDFHANAAYRGSLDLGVIADDNDRAWKTFTVTIKRPAGAPTTEAAYNGTRVYLMANWTGWTESVKTIEFDGLNFRPSTQAEIEAYEAEITLNAWAQPGTARGEITGGKISDGTVDAEVLLATTTVTSQLIIDDNVGLGRVGSIESGSYYLSGGTEGFRLDKDSLEILGDATGNVSIVLGSSGLNLNTSSGTSGQIWFGSAGFLDAATTWRVDSDGSMRIGGPSAFYADATGNIWSGHATRTSAPWNITAAGAATFKNVTLDTTGMTGSTVVFNSGNFQVTAAGNVTAQNITATGGTIGSTTIDATKLIGGIIEGTTFNVKNGGGIVFDGSGGISWGSGASGGITLSNSGFVKSANFNATNKTGFNFDASGVQIYNGTITANALQIGVSGVNLFTNSSFENGTSNATSWITTTGSTYLVTNEQTLYQAKSQKMTITTAGTRYIEQDIKRPNNASFSTTETITVSFWVKQTTGAARAASIQVLNTSNTQLSLSGNTTTTVGTWVRVVYSFRLTSAQTTLRIRLRLTSTAINDVFYLDGAMATVSDFATEYAPAPLEIPDNYIQSVHISQLTADRIGTGIMDAATITVGPTGSIKSSNLSGTAGYEITSTGATFLNGGINIVGTSGSSLLSLSAGEIKLSTSGATKYLADYTGFYLGGSSSANASFYYDNATGDVIFQSQGGTNQLIIDAEGTTENKVIRLTDGTNDTFFLKSDGTGSFSQSNAGGTNGRGYVLNENGIAFWANEFDTGNWNNATFYVDALTGNAHFGGTVVIGENNTYDPGYNPVEVEASVKSYVQSRGENLVTNGTGLLEDNTNFTTWTAYDPAERYAGGGSFKQTTSGQIVRQTDELIPVDPFRAYKFSTAIKKVPAQEASNFYHGFTCYDADRLSIGTPNVAYTAGTETTLAQPLNPNDTTITLTSAASWSNSATGHYRNIIFYGYTNAQGYTYPDYTYSRNVSTNNPGYSDGIYAVGGITGNVITLKAPWTGAAYPAGTAVANAHSGGSYNYLTSSVPVPDDWTVFSGVAEGLAPPGTYPAANFRQGTAFVKVLYLFGYGGISTTIDLWIDAASVELDYTTVVESQALSDKKPVTIRKTSTPVAGDLAPFGDRTTFIDGDIWIDTSAGGKNEMKVYGSGSFQSVRDVTISEADGKAENANTNADAKNVIIRAIGPNAPTTTGASSPARTALITGDIWIDTLNGQNQMWVYNGTSFISARDITAINTGALNSDPMFYNWSSGTFPAGWGEWSGAGATKVAGRLGSQAVQMAAVAADQGGLHVVTSSSTWLDGSATKNYEYVTIETTVRLDAGTFNGSGILLDWAGNGSVGRSYIRFSGVVSGSQYNMNFEQEIGVWQTVRKTIKRPSAAPLTNGYQFYIMVNYASLGATDAKTISIDKFELMPASKQEIEAYEAENTITAWAGASGTDRTIINGGKIETNTLLANQVGTGFLSNMVNVEGETISVDGATGGFILDSAGLRFFTDKANPTTTETINLRSSDGSATFEGAITGGTIDIGDFDASSFHVDVGGNMWVGAGALGIAPFGVSATGDLVASSANITGKLSVQDPDVQTNTNLALAATMTASTGATLLNDGNTTDNDVTTTYANFGAGSGLGNGAESNHLEADFGTVKDIAEIKIYFYRPHERYYYYKVKYSEDGITWYYAAGSSPTSGWLESAQTNETSNSVAKPTSHVFQPRIRARYIRVYGDGSTANTGNHAYEFEAFPYSRSELLTVGSNFTVDAEGNLYANNAYFKGTIDATGGTFSGNITSSGTITGGNIRTAASGARMEVKSTGSGLIEFYNALYKTAEIKFETAGITIRGLNNINVEAGVLIEGAAAQLKSTLYNTTITAPASYDIELDGYVSGTVGGDVKFRNVDLRGFNQTLSASAGTIDFPIYTFVDDPDTGIYKKATNYVGIAGGLYLDYNATLTTGASANMYITATAGIEGRIYRSTSSARYKDDITALPSQWDKLSQISMVSWLDKGEVERDEVEGRHVGVTAEAIHDLELPWAVTYAEYEGVSLPESVQYERVALVAALEGIQKINDLHSQIALLESRVKEIEDLSSLKPRLDKDIT